jgi:P-type Cu+ transporter
MFSITGMTCANCAMRIEKALLKMPGIAESVAAEAAAASSSSSSSGGGGMTGGKKQTESLVSVSSMTNKAKVLVNESAPDAAGPRSIIAKIEHLGYGCRLHSIDGKGVDGAGNTIGGGGGGSSDGGGDGDMDAGSAEMAEWYFPLLVSLVLGVPVMVMHLAMTNSDEVMMLFDQPAACHGGVNRMQLVMLLLNLPILVIVGYRYYRGAVLGAMTGNFGMDCLVTTGTSITFLYSVVQVCIACSTHVPTPHVFFETTGMLLMFVTVGKFVEAYAKRRSYAAISNLLKLQPREVRLQKYCVFF